MKRVLIVEDDKSIAELQRDYLELSGYESTLAFTGHDGLKLALDGEYDLIILDVMLPGMNGFDICKRIREEKQTPVLFVTARQEDIHKIRGLGLGADDYVTKPFSPSELVARVSAHISRFERLTQTGGGTEAAGRTESMDLGRLVIHPAARQVLVAGEEVAMTGKEFDLLLYLVQHPNQVFSKEQLLNRIWGVDAFVESATVTVHIKKIREKVEPVPSKPTYIQTVWGIGYKFVI